MQNNQLVVSGQNLVLPDLGHAVNDKYSLVGARRFVAAKAGLTEAEIEKKTMKEVKDLCVAAGIDEAEIKAWRAEYDSIEKSYRKFSRQATALFSSDPAFRQAWKPNFNAKGQFIGATTTFRKERSLSQSANVRLEQAEARVKQLEALIAKLGATPALTA
jgi:hypothetical protein